MASNERGPLKCLRCWNKHVWKTHQSGMRRRCVFTCTLGVHAVGWICIINDSVLHEGRFWVTWLINFVAARNVFRAGISMHDPVREQSQISIYRSVVLGHVYAAVLGHRGMTGRLLGIIISTYPLCDLHMWGIRMFERFRQPKTRMRWVTHRIEDAAEPRIASSSPIKSFFCGSHS